MLFDCLTDSLTKSYKETIESQITECTNDGVKLLHYMISQAKTSTSLATRDLKRSMQNLKLKDFGYDIQKLHGHLDRIED